MDNYWAEQAIISGARQEELNYASDLVRTLQARVTALEAQADQFETVFATIRQEAEHARIRATQFSAIAHDRQQVYGTLPPAILEMDTQFNLNSVADALEWAVRVIKPTLTEGKPLT